MSVKCHTFLLLNFNVMTLFLILLTAFLLKDTNPFIILIVAHLLQGFINVTGICPVNHLVPPKSPIQFITSVKASSFITSQSPVNSVQNHSYLMFSYENDKIIKQEINKPGLTESCHFIKDYLDLLQIDN